jgi:NAD(P)-dependent dehydrogenase (short-subunit alcohol dehydrogenase family)
LEANLQAVLDNAIKDTGGPLDHVVYTAGSSFHSTALAKTTASTALSSFTVHYLGPLLVGKLVAAHPGRYLTSTVGSSITPTSGMWAHRPMKGIDVVGATEVLARTLAVELAPTRVNVIVVGPVQSDLLEKLAGGKEGVLKVGPTSGIAEAYLFCIRSSLATGQGFIVDKGVSLAQGVERWKINNNNER